MVIEFRNYGDSWCLFILGISDAVKLPCNYKEFICFITSTIELHKTCHIPTDLLQLYIMFVLLLEFDLR